MDALWLPAIASMFLCGAGHIVYVKTLQKVEASVFSVFFATQAVWIMLLGVFWFSEGLTVLMTLVFLKSERTLVGRKTAAAIACTLGVILIVAKGMQRLLPIGW